VYKEIALGKNDLNGMYLNGWVAIFQVIFTFIISVPSVYAQPGLTIKDLWPNFINGFKCLGGMRSAC
jgi:hypothetical protein